MEGNGRESTTLSIAGKYYFPNLAIMIASESKRFGRMPEEILSSVNNSNRSVAFYEPERGMPEVLADKF